MINNTKKYIEVICNTCKKPVNKQLKEYKRRIKNGKDKFYCNLSCAFKANPILQENIEKVKNGIIKNDISKFSGNKRDEFSPFKYYISKAKSKERKENYGETNLTLEYLKQLWDSQDGICSYTGIKMELPKTTNLRKTKHNLNKASLDRIDSNKGYIQDNVEFICLGINLAKNGFLKLEVIEFITKIIENANNGKIRYLNKIQF